MGKLTEYFMEYVRTDTQSDARSTATPSTAGQLKLAGKLVEELENIGAQEIVFDREHCYVYAAIPASEGWENVRTPGFIAHMDTSPAVSGKGVNPRLLANYGGEDILLNEEKKIVMRTCDFPELLNYRGQSLIVTDGTTLLGADDKAGIAEIMAMAVFLTEHRQIRHGRVAIAFTPDEEIGSGADYFDVEQFGADYAYTVDGGRLGELEYENFNAAEANVVFHGRSVHPGDARGKMKNAILLAQEFQAMLPPAENPMYTEGYEGFYHLDSIKGNVEQTESEYLIRDHDREKFEEKKRLFLAVGDYMNGRYGEGTVKTALKDSYYNMREIIEKNMHLIDHARDAMEELGISPVTVPIRGGTDGARLSFMGLPCPNLNTGGHNFHGCFEYVCVESMEKIVELLVRIVEKYGPDTPKRM